LSKDVVVSEAHQEAGACVFWLLESAQLEHLAQPKPAKPFKPFPGGSGRHVPDVRQSRYDAAV